MNEWMKWKFNEAILIGTLVVRESLIILSKL